MTCKLHDQPESMACSHCTDHMCPMCAEYMDGRWFCAACAAKERRIAAGIDYHYLIGEGGQAPEVSDLPVQSETVEL